MALIPRAPRRISAAAGLLAALVMPLSVLGFTPATAGASAPSSPTVEAVCPPASPGFAQCLALRRTDVEARPATAMSPMAPPAGYSPADIQSAYALPSGSEGLGLTVAVVDAFDLPTAEADLCAYRTQFGLPACTTANGCFRKVNQRGVAGSYPADSAGWGQEIALDIEMVSAACPNCHILLVETDSSSLNDLGAGVDTAVSLGAVAVSNSYGGPEWSGELAGDAHYNHPGVAVTASTGDCGYNCAQDASGYHQSVQYPAASPYVVAVGGTRLVGDGSARGWAESAWGDAAHAIGAGSGCSAYEPKPAWQQDAGCARRTQADVSAVADPATGVAAYYNGNWYVFGGTSAASPIIASVFALAGGPAPGTYPASYLYGAGAGLNDVTSGNNDIRWGNCSVIYFCTGVAGYDGPTGLGTPNGTVAFTAPASPDVGATYVPLTPARILDTRVGNGLSGRFTAGVPRAFQVSGRGGVPAGATAVTGNLTVTDQTFGWAVYLGPVATPNPTSSTINFTAGQVVANGVTVALASDGSLSATYLSTPGNTTNLVFDVTGYFVPDMTGATYHALTPARILDTRVGNGLSGRFTAGVPRAFQVSGRGGVPAGATAVTGNLTVTDQTFGWAVYLGPVATPNPTSSTINFTAGQVVSNGVTVALASDGSLSATYLSTPGNTTNLVFDVTGYFTPDVSGERYFPLTPARLLDTRHANGISGPLRAGQPGSFPIFGRGGVPGSAAAVTGNLTVTDETFGWAVFLGPDATPAPATSTINFWTGDVRANGVTVALSGTGTLSATYISSTGQTTSLVFDVTGYFAP